MVAFSVCPHVAFLLCTPPGVSLWVQILSSYEDTSQMGLGPILMASFEFGSLFKRPCLHMESCPEVLGVRALLYGFGGGI